MLSWDMGQDSAVLLPAQMLRAAHQASAKQRIKSAEDHLQFPPIASPSKTMAANRSSNMSSTASPSHRRATSMSPMGKRAQVEVKSPVSKPGAMSLAEIAKVGPSTLDELKFTVVSAPSKSVSVGRPLGGDSEEAKERELIKLSAAGPQEQYMSVEQKELVADVRTEVLMFKPEKAVLLNKLHDLVESLVVDVRDRESTIDRLKGQLKQQQESAATAKQIAEDEIQKKEQTISARDKDLMQADLKRLELEETIKGLEERLNTAAGMGMTPDEAARTMMQLTKAKASIEAMKKQIAALEDKVVGMEKIKRQEEMALKEKKAAIERQLKETLAQYGPARCQELTEQLHEATQELKVTSENLSKSCVAQKQQHKLVVSWRISVDEITEKMTSQKSEMEAMQADIEGKAALISDLETQLMQAEQDLKKQTLQLTELNEKLNEYIEKYTRQAAYISQMEAAAKAAEAQRLLVNEGDDSD